MEERGVVAVLPEQPQHAVQIPVHHPERGGGGGGEGVGLHARQHVKLRVGSAASKAGRHHMAADGVAVPLQGVEVGQGVLRVGEHRVVCQIGKGLVHHHDEVDILALALLRGSGVPGHGLGLAEALRPVHGIGGELVAEAVGEAKLVEHGGDIIGVGDVEGVVQVVGGVHRQDQRCQHAEAGGGAQKAAQPAPELFDGEGPAADEHAQHRQHRRGGHHHGNDLHREVDVVGAHGAAHFLQKGEVTGEHRLVPDLQLDAVGDGQGAHGEVHQGSGEKQVPQQAGERQQQKADGQAVQHDQQRLAAEIGHDGPQRVGLAPQRQQRDAACQGHGGQQGGPQGQAEPGKAVRMFQRRQVLSLVSVIVLLYGFRQKKQGREKFAPFYPKCCWISAPAVSRTGPVADNSGAWYHKLDQSESEGRSHVP